MRLSKQKTETSSGIQKEAVRQSGKFLKWSALLNMKPYELHSAKRLNLTKCGMICAFPFRILL